jgi:hypothetical protein
MAEIDQAAIAAEVARRLAHRTTRAERRAAAKGKRWPLASQLSGAAMIVVSVALLVGFPWALLAAGIGVGAVGTLREAGLI